MANTKGLVFFDRSEAICNIEDYEPFLKLQQATYHTHAIIRSYLKMNGERNVVRFEETLLLATHRIKAIKKKLPKDTIFSEWR